MSATDTTLAATVTATQDSHGADQNNNKDGRERQNQVSNPLRSWSCNTCKLSFDDGQAQRQHMKESWHVYNIQRRIASLPPISLEIFTERVQPRSEIPEATSRDASEGEASDEADEEVISPLQCLFCQQDLEVNETGPESVLDHMLTVHGLFIPQPQLISDMESFLGYLATQIRVWHECLYCGTTRDSVLAIQSHMRDRSHCMLNLEREPELLEFWEDEDVEEGLDHSSEARLKMMGLSAEEVQLASGKVVASRHAHRRRAVKSWVREPRQALLADTDASTQPEVPRKLPASRQLARRDEMSIQGIDTHRRQALLVAEKRSQKQEEVATRAKEWATARKANRQKYDQNFGPLAWAKGGLHNLLPR